MRFANDKIAELVKYIQTPHSERQYLTKDDGYFYGMNERQWKDSQEQLHKDIKNRQYPNASIKREIMEDFGFTGDEADTVIRHSMYKKDPRHVNKGVPHAFTTEEVARQALLGSGHKANRLNSSDHMGTDLEAMIGNLNKYIDVQMSYKPKGVNNRVIIPVINNLPQGMAPKIKSESRPNQSLQQVLKLADDMSEGNWTRDKLMQSRLGTSNNALNRITEDKVKDMLLVGNYDINKVNNLVKSHHGHYNPRAPKDMSIIDLDMLRKKIIGMSQQDIRREGGSLRYFDDYDGNRIKLELPMKAIQRLGAQNNDVLDPQVIHELNRLSQSPESVKPIF